MTKVVLVSGGTGGARLAAGLQAALDPGALTVVANVADDCRFWGLHISPDTDAVLFRLAGIFNEERGFGVAGDTFSLQEQMALLGAPAWFALGDRDLAFHVLRTEMLASGARLTETALELGRRLGIPSRVLPVTDDPVRTWLQTDDGPVPFQEYYVRLRAQPPVRAVSQAGIESARPAPEVLAALEEADLVVIGPSNPVVSVWPVLQLLPGHLRPERTVAVSPLVGGRALKGPTLEMMRSLGREPTATGVAREYAALARGFVLDGVDEGERPAIEALGYRVLLTDTLMPDAAAAEGLARRLLAGF